MRLWKEYYVKVDHPLPSNSQSKNEIENESDTQNDLPKRSSIKKRKKKPQARIDTDYGKLMWMEDILFPWILPSFATIKDMERSFSGDGIVMCVNDK